jgi:hypothetical protein
MNEILVSNTHLIQNNNVLFHADNKMVVFIFIVISHLKKRILVYLMFSEIKLFLALTLKMIV